MSDKTIGYLALRLNKAEAKKENKCFFAKVLRKEEGCFGNLLFVSVLQIVLFAGLGV